MLKIDKIIKKIQNLKCNMTSYIHSNLTAIKKVGIQLQDDLAPVLEPLEDYLRIYINEFQKNIIPQNSKYKYIVCVIHTLHIIGVILFVLFGFFIPPRLQIYIALFYLTVLLSWFIFGKCILVILTNYIGGTHDDYLVPLRSKTMYLTTAILIFISLIFNNIPFISPFNLLILLDKYSETTLDYLQKYIKI